jgi:hypothetical protein
MTSLFRSLLGDALDRVPAPVRALHEATLPRRFEGRALVRAAEGVIARWIATRAGLPGTNVEAPIAVTIEPGDEGGEIWTRDFPGRSMRTLLRRDGECLHERLGPVEMRFRLEADETGIVWHPVSALSDGVAAPPMLLRGVHAREYVRDGRYAFDVGARLPWIGHVVAYDGWLDAD